MSHLECDIGNVNLEKQGRMRSSKLWDLNSTSTLHLSWVGTRSLLIMSTTRGSNNTRALLAAKCSNTYIISWTMYNVSPRRVSRHASSCVLFASLKINRCTCVKYHCGSIDCVVYEDSIIRCIPYFVSCCEPVLRCGRKSSLVDRQPRSPCHPSLTSAQPLPTILPLLLSTLPAASHTAPLP